MTPNELAQALPIGGSASIPYTDPFNPERKLVLECHRPANHTPDRPVVIVQHGMNRNGGEYRDAWVPTADRHGLLIVAITFPPGLTACFRNPGVSPATGVSSGPTSKGVLRRSVRLLDWK